MSQALVDSALEGKVVGRFAVERLAAKGGMAWVYKAIDQGTQAEVALKVLFSKWAEDPKVRERFMQEGRVLSALVHPNIIHMLSFIEQGGLIGMAMEWANSGDLKELLEQRQQPLSAQEIHDIFLPMTEAIGFAHQQGIVHRDIKPGNVLLHFDGHRFHPKFTDFGIAKVLSDPGVTVTGAKLGTPYYMPPEQWKDSKRVNHRADIYSLGVILYRMLTGRLPFEGDYQSVIIKLLDETPAYPKDIPAPLAGLLLRCLEKDPDKRYQSCDALATALRKFLPLLGEVRVFPSADVLIPDTPAPGALDGSTMAYIPSFNSAEFATGTEQTLDMDEHVVQPEVSGEMASQGGRLFDKTAAFGEEEVLALQERLQQAAVAAQSVNTQVPHLQEAESLIPDDPGPQGELLLAPSAQELEADEDYQQAMAYASKAEKQQVEASQATMVLNEDDPQLALFKARVGQGSGPQESLAVSGARPPWLLPALGGGLVVLGVLLGWILTLFLK